MSRRLAATVTAIAAQTEVRRGASRASSTAAVAMMAEWPEGKDWVLPLKVIRMNSWRSYSNSEPGRVRPKATFRT